MRVHGPGLRPVRCEHIAQGFKQRGRRGRRQARLRGRAQLVRHAQQQAAHFLLLFLLRRQQALDAEILAATEHALAAEGFAGGQGLTFRVFAEVMAGLRER